MSDEGEREDVQTDKQPDEIRHEEAPTEGNASEPRRAKNGQFVKGSRPPPGAGRPKGSPNRFTKDMHEVFLDVFNKMQRDPRTRLLAWAKSSPGEFYRLAVRLMPAEMNLTAKIQEPDEPVDVVQLARMIAFGLRLGAEEQDKREAAKLPQLAAPIPPEPKPEPPTVDEPEPRVEPGPYQPDPLQWLEESRRLERRDQREASRLVRPSVHRPYWRKGR